MAAGTGNMRGLLVVGAVLALAAITISAGRRDSPPPDATDSTRVEDAIKNEETMPAPAKTQGSVEHANDTDFRQKVLDVDGRVLVDFHADWCGPCRVIAPLLVELAREEPNARIVKVDVDASPNLAAQYRINSIPALIVFENGRPVSRHLGVASKARLRSMLGL